MNVLTADMATQSTANKFAAESPKQRGEVLGILKQLLAERQDDAVIELFSKLVAQNAELQQQPAEMLVRKKKGEGVSEAQLKLFLEELSDENNQDLENANQKLVNAADLDKTGEKRPLKPGKQPRHRRKIPEKLRRVDNPIEVSEQDRTCPICGKERKCIGHDVTEVIELIPAKVIVRRDIRGKIACESCEGEIVRAQLGEKVVGGGVFGCRFVSHLLVDKYRNGLPLHRQKQRLEKLELPVSISTLADQITWTTDLLRPLWKAAMAMVLGSVVMQLDGDRHSGTGSEPSLQVEDGHPVGIHWRQPDGFVFVHRNRKKTCATQGRAGTGRYVDHEIQVLASGCVQLV